MSKKNKENYVNMQNALYHIHSIADVLEDISKDDNYIITDTKNMTSAPLMSLAQIIKEKAEFCLHNMQEVKQ